MTTNLSNHENIQIFPFSSLEIPDFEDYEEFLEINDNQKSIRGILVNKTILDLNNISVFINGNEIDKNIVFWNPAFKKSNEIEKGLHLIESGLGFVDKNAKKTGITEYFVKNQRK